MEPAWVGPSWLLTGTFLELLFCSLMSSRSLGRSAEILPCPGGTFCVIALGGGRSLTREHGKEKLFTWFCPCVYDWDLLYWSRKDVFMVAFIILGSPSTREGCDTHQTRLGHRRSGYGRTSPYCSLGSQSQQKHLSTGFPRIWGCFSVQNV